MGIFSRTKDRLIEQMGLAYLNGHQKHFVMVGGQQSARSLLHLVEAFRLADAAGLIRDPDLAAARLKDVMRTHGVAA